MHLALAAREDRGRLGDPGRIDPGLLGDLRRRQAGNPGRPAPAPAPGPPACAASATIACTTIVSASGAHSRNSSANLAVRFSFGPTNTILAPFRMARFAIRSTTKCSSSSVRAGRPGSPAPRARSAVGRRRDDVGREQLPVDQVAERRDVVRAERDPGELLRQVDLLVGQPRRHEHRDLARPSTAAPAPSAAAPRRRSPRPTGVSCSSRPGRTRPVSSRSCACT